MEPFSCALICLIYSPSFEEFHTRKGSSACLTLIVKKCSLGLRVNTGYSAPFALLIEVAYRIMRADEKFAGVG